MTARLLNSYDVRKVRSLRVDYGTVDHVTVGRSALCRCCGQPMSKGTSALAFHADFVGSGSWTLVRCLMHADACEPANPNGGCANL